MKFYRQPHTRTSNCTGVWKQTMKTLTVFHFSTTDALETCHNLPASLRKSDSSLCVWRVIKMSCNWLCLFMVFEKCVKKSWHFNNYSILKIVFLKHPVNDFNERNGEKWNTKCVSHIGLIHCLEFETKTAYRLIWNSFDSRFISFAYILCVQQRFCVTNDLFAKRCQSQDKKCCFLLEGHLKNKETNLQPCKSDVHDVISHAKSKPCLFDHNILLNLITNWMFYFESNQICSPEVEFV